MRRFPALGQSWLGSAPSPITWLPTHLGRVPVLPFQVPGEAWAPPGSNHPALCVLVLTFGEAQATQLTVSVWAPWVLGPLLRWPLPGIGAWGGVSVACVLEAGYRRVTGESSPALRPADGGCGRAGAVCAQASSGWEGWVLSVRRCLCVLDEVGAAPRRSKLWELYGPSAQVTSRIW